MEFVLEFVLKYIFDERWIKTLNWMMSQNLKNITGKLYYNIKVGLISSLLKIRKVESDVLIFSNILLYINLRNFKRYNFNSAKMIKQNMIFMLLLLLLLNVNFGKFQKITQTIS